MKKSLIPTDKIAPGYLADVIETSRSFWFMQQRVLSKRYLRPWSSSQAACEPGFSACLIQRFVGYLWNLNVFKSIHRARALTRALSFLGRLRA